MAFMEVAPLVVEVENSIVDTLAKEQIGFVIHRPLLGPKAMIDLRMLEGLQLHFLNEYRMYRAVIYVHNS